MTKIGLLNACTPHEEAEFDNYELEAFADLINQVPNQIDLAEYRITEGQFPQSAAECDGYIITGSPAGAYDDLPWIHQLGDFIRQAHTAGIRLVGICFGHQILAHSLGGRAEKSDKGWGMGLRQFTLEMEQKPDWMSLPAEDGACNLYFCHQDQVIQLPNNATWLAGNEFCPNMMFAIEDKVLGMQGHPEFTPRVMDAAIGYFEDKLDGEFIQEVATTTHTDTKADGRYAAEWIVAFLEAQ